jgi:serine/threonine-protein kinase
MEYLDGESLWSRIERLGPRPASEVVAFVSHVARALAEAHGREIVHRDVKPENILFVEDTERPLGFSAKLIDFGLANRTAKGGPPEAGATAGTPSYMTPEYLRGHVGPTPALDLWGLAATAFVAMTGVVAFDGQDVRDVFRRVCSQPTPVPSQVATRVPPGFDAWFARACAKDPAERYQSAPELAAALVAACGGGVNASPVPAVASASTWGNQLPVMATEVLEGEPDSVRALLAAKR